MLAILILSISLSVFAAITLFKLVSIYSVKLSAYALDFLLVFGVSAIYAHQLFINKLVSGWMVYACDIAVALLITLAYGILILIIHNKLPKVSYVLNFFIVLIGVSVAFPLALDLVSSLLKVLGVVKDSFTQISLFGNQTGNTILNYGIIVILAIPVYLGRMKYLNSDIR